MSVSANNVLTNSVIAVTNAGHGYGHAVARALAKAGATVIDLTGLTAIPDAQEIKAFNVATSEAVVPGSTQRFFAANDPQKLLFVLFANDDGGPQIREVH